MVTETQSMPLSNVTDEGAAQFNLVARWAAGSAAAAIHKFFPSVCNDGIGILMYHRVTENVSGVPAPTCNVTPPQLHHQLSGLLVAVFSRGRYRSSFSAATAAKLYHRKYLLSRSTTATKTIT